MLNRGCWKELEDYTRQLIVQGNECYLIAGEAGIGGDGDKGPLNTLDNGRLSVPDYCWKVILVLPVGTNDISRVDAQTRVIAVWMENVNEAGHKPREEYRTTIDRIEGYTGLDLLSKLPQTLQNRLEANIDQVIIQ